METQNNMVSVLIPTRKRIPQFISSIESLFNTCNNFKNFEVLVALDNDDLDTIEHINDYIKDKSNITIHLFDRHYYKGFHKYINSIVPLSKGSSLFLWNDDCIMKSIDWDVEILKLHQSFCVLNPLVDTMAFYCRSNQQILFPIIPKQWYITTGRWSNNAACDTWIQDISRDLNLTVDVDNIVISHERHDVTGKNGDDIYNEGRIDVETFIRDDFYSAEQFAEREIDKQKIKNFLNERFKNN